MTRIIPHQAASILTLPFMKHSILLLLGLAFLLLLMSDRFLKEVRVAQETITLDCHVEDGVPKDVLFGDEQLCEEGFAETKQLMV
jgi:hypothetical protein